MKKLLADHIYEILLALIIIIALGLRLYRLGMDSLWLDESYSVVLSQNDSLQKIIELTNNDIHPPLYYIILHFFLKISGSIEVMARLPSVIFGVLTVPAIYYAGVRLFDKKTALVASFLCAISIVGITYSQEARMYAMLAFISIIEIYAFYRAITENRRSSWAIFILSASLIIYTHYYGGVLTLALAIYGFAELSRHNISNRSLKITDDLKNFILSLAIIFLIILPQMLVAIHQSSSGMANSEVHPNDLLFFPKIFYFLAVGGIKNPMTYLTLATAVAFLVLAATGVLASIVAGKKKQTDVLLFFVVVLAVSAAAGFLLTYKIRFCGYRYFLFLLAPFLLMVGYGIRTFPGFLLENLRGMYENKGDIHRALKSHRVAYSVLSIVVLTLLVSSPGIFSYSPLYSGSNVDLRDAIQYVKDNGMPGDHMVILNSDPISRNFYAGYLRMGDRIVNMSGDQLKSTMPDAVQWVIISGDSDWPENKQIRPWLDGHMKLYANMTLVAVYGSK